MNALALKFIIRIRTLPMKYTRNVRALQGVSASPEAYVQTASWRCPITITLHSRAEGPHGMRLKKRHQECP
jgi:hypothetical protein